MSKLVLDFDLSSSQRRRTTNRIGGTSSPNPSSSSSVPIKKIPRKLVASKKTVEKNVLTETPPLEPPLEAPEEEISEVTGLCERLQKAQQNNIVFFGVVVVVFVLCLCCFFLLGASTHTVSASRDLLVHSQCTTQAAYIVCHAESCNLKGACHATSKNIVFTSMDCADAVRTVAIHQSDGTVEHYPAYYLRVFNTATFAIDGKRALFSPVLPTCHATSWPTKTNRVSNVVSKRLRGSVVWVAPKQFSRFSLYRDDHLVAVMEEDMVLVKRVSSSHFVYRFELACRHWEEEDDLLTVFGEDDDTKTRKELKSFNYCR